MITKFILIVIFTHGYGPRTNYASLGEFTTLESCTAAAKAVRNTQSKSDLMGDTAPRFICAAK